MTSNIKDQRNYKAVLSEDAEDLLHVEGVYGGEVLQHVELDGLGKRSALSDGDEVSLLHVEEGGRAVDGHIRVALLKSAKEKRHD